MNKEVIKNFIRTSVANHNHTLTATSVLHHFGVDDPKEARKVQRFLRSLIKKNNKSGIILRVLDKDRRYTPKTNSREGNLYLVMECANVREA